MGKSSGWACAITVLPVSSRRTPSGKRIWAGAQNRSGTRSKAPTSAPKKPGSISMSLFSRQMCEYRAHAMPRFTARAKESGWFETSMRTCGQAARGHRAVPSLEPLSTTTISAANDSSSRAMPGSCASSSSFPLRDGMTTEMPVSAGRGSPGGGLRHLGRNAPATRAVAYQQTVWIRGFTLDQQVPEDPCISGAALVPKSQRLEREGRGHRVHIRQPGPGLASEIEAAAGGGVGTRNLELCQPFRLELGGGEIQRQGAGPVGIEAHAQQLGVDVW